MTKLKPWQIGSAVAIWHACEGPPGISPEDIAAIIQRHYDAAFPKCPKCDGVGRSCSGNFVCEACGGKGRIVL